jgi:hypothetical protein
VCGYSAYHDIDCVAGVTVQNCNDDERVPDPFENPAAMPIKVKREREGGRERLREREREREREEGRETEIERGLTREVGKGSLPSNNPHDYILLRVDLARTGGGNALAIKQPTLPYDIESGPGGLAREVETPLPSNSPHDHMILRVDRVGSRGRWKRPCLQTAHMTI